MPISNGGSYCLNIMNSKPINLLDWRTHAYKVRLAQCTITILTTLMLSSVTAHLFTTYWLLSPTRSTSQTPPDRIITTCKLKHMSQQLQQLKKDISRQHNRRQQHNHQAHILSAIARQCRPPCQLTELKFSQSKWAISGFDSKATDINTLLHHLNQLHLVRFHLKQVADKQNQRLSFLIEGAPNDV